MTKKVLTLTGDVYFPNKYMKKIFFPLLVFLILNFSGFNGYAQTQKLNTAFYFSSGIVVDSRGNAFVTGKNNKIIKITTDGRASHFAGSPHGFTGNEDGIKGKFNNTRARA